MEPSDLCNIKSEYREEFNRRYTILKPHVRHARDFLCDRLVYKQFDMPKEGIFLSGQCAAWLLGRLDELGSRVDVTIIGSHPQEFGLYGWEADGLANGLPDDADVSVEAGALYTASTLELNHLGRVIRFVFLFNILDVNTLAYVPFDISVSAMFVNLYNVSVVFVAECPCDYEGRCTVSPVSNRVTYPLLFEPSAVVLPLDEHMTGWRTKLVTAVTRTVPVREPVRGCFAHASRLYLRRFFCRYSLFHKYAKLASSRTDCDKERPLSFYTYPDCAACAKRNTLTRWAFDWWVRRTYRPVTGYGYRQAVRRFNQITAGAKCLSKSI